MLEKEFKIYHEGEYSYPAAYGFEPFLHAYLHEDSELRPVMLIAPGGGYRFVSPSEGEIVARAFYEKGYQCFVLTYTVNMLDLAPLNMQPLHDISRAVRFVRKNASEFGADGEKLSVCGFSAAGHLCASLAVHWMDDREENPEYQTVSNRPQAAILSYPVITSGEYAHRDSFTALLSADASDEMLQYMSLETQVTKDTIPCFIWATATDELVPVENSYLFSEALKKNGILYALHVFSEGKHGLSVGTQDWADNKYAANYPAAQLNALAEAYKNGEFELHNERAIQMLQFFTMEERPELPEEYRSYPVPEVQIWPLLADQWLKKVYGD